MPSTGLPAPCSCFTLLCLQVQRPAGRQSSETSWRQTLLVDAARCVLVHYWVCAVLLRTTARCSACAAFVVASAAGLQGGCRRDSPSCGTHSCVRFRSCRARVMRLWAGSHRCETLSLWFRTIWKFAFPWDEAVRSTKSPLKPLRTSYSVQPENNSRGGPDRSRPKRLIAPPLR